MMRLAQSAERSINVFAYGSNLSIERMQDRIAGAKVLATGYVRGRKLVFHKRSFDGSGKANAALTGCDADCVWGAVYRMTTDECRVLDRHEFLGIGYDRQEVDVIAVDGSFRACMYLARSEAIDDSLRPYDWYHDFVLQGAEQHQLPPSYIEHLVQLESIADLDIDRDRRNRLLLSSRR